MFAFWSLMQKYVNTRQFFKAEDMSLKCTKHLRRYNAVPALILFFFIILI